MRIASLVPSSTEMLFALGLGDAVVAVTHECDHPPGVMERLPHLTRSVIPEGLSAPEIDAAVRERTSAGRALYELDEPLLAELGVDLIVTQAVCEVCAVSYDDVIAAAGRLERRPAVLSLDPSTLGDVLADVPRLAEAGGVDAAGRALLDDATRRIDAVSAAVAGAARPRVAAIEWLDPVFLGGHWVPQMIDLAGGEDVLGLPGEKSRTATWDEVAAARPELVVSMPCGYGTDQAARETRAARGALARLDARVVAVDASAYFSRPGPRLVDGIELLGHLFHPDRVAAPPAGRFAEVDTRPPGPDWIERHAVGAKRAERQGIVGGTPQQCFDALTDFESYPEWQAAVKDCTVLTRDDDGRGRRVSFQIDAKVRSVSYTLDYSYDEPGLLSWDFVEGDVKDVDGEFLLEDLGDGTTLATYALRIDPGVWMPGKLVSILTDQVMQRSVDDLKTRVEAGA